MGNLFKMTEKEEKEYQRKAKQYARVKALIIFLLIGFSVVSGIIVVSNGFIFKWFGIENYRMGL
ncbi:MAG: hypothetical protein J6V66_00130, partial [Clostridia bacterium]|nr:hypothetical protein [Clostridia bacterium]